MDPKSCCTISPAYADTPYVECLQGSVIMASAQSCTHTTIQMFDDEEEEKAMLERQNIDDRSATSYVRSIIIVLILSYINLVIYMDSFTDEGVMPNLQSHFKMESSGLGLKNIVPICSQVLADQVFGYLGDRFNRKNIMCAGMSFWAIMNLCITFIPNESSHLWATCTTMDTGYIGGMSTALQNAVDKLLMPYFHLFLEMRRLIGVLKACCSTLAPSIIADLLVGRQRGCMLSIYYITEPVGCGLGFIIASTVTRAAGGDWHWAFRKVQHFISSLDFLLTSLNRAEKQSAEGQTAECYPWSGPYSSLLIISFVKEPQREIFDRNNNKLPICKKWMMDMKHLLKNKSFMLSTCGIVTVTFVTAAITFWAPSFLMLSGAVTKQKEPCQTDVCNYHDRLLIKTGPLPSAFRTVTAGRKVKAEHSGCAFTFTLRSPVSECGKQTARDLTDTRILIFGILAVSSSAFGIVAGVKIAEIYKKYDPCGDPKVCAVSLLIGSIFLYLALFLANISFMASYVFIVIVEILLSLNFAIAADIHLYVVSPRRRSTGQAIVIMVSGLTETAESSNVIGKV
ncbi:unnamed protein product [Ranitomeya imitator]|uniref:Major facilitator superfamily (MFS) profile domain-containing protein n=1 Tax=Ranitomeya imitator TaxID=111125 RepID=A0ABN9KQG1_9NEOB|nr:unnamed protein product [Ranitomeya imitator]